MCLKIVLEKKIKVFLEFFEDLDLPRPDTLPTDDELPGGVPVVPDGFTMAYRTTPE